MDPVQFMGGADEVLARLGVATLIGSALGLHRELHGKPAGLRIHALVGLGSSLITVTSVQLAFDGSRVDGAAVVRAIQGIITGIGFLGGGVILRDNLGKSVHGLTTAATIWIAAGLGIVCGAGQWLTGLMALGLTLAVLIFGGPLERFIHRHTHATNPPGEPPEDPQAGP